MKRTTRRAKQTTPENNAAVAVDDKQQQNGKRVEDLEQENKALKREVEELRGKLANSSVASVEGSRKKDGDYLNKLNVLEDKVAELKTKLYAQSQRSVQRPKTDDAVKRLQDEIQMLKAHKVQLLCKMKLEAVQFRLCKTTLEKEVLQLKKEGRKHEYEIQKLSSLNEGQKKVLQRKTQEASAATKRLKEIVELRKRGARNQNCHEIKSIENELEVTERVREVCAEYEQQMEERAEEIARLEKEIEALREENFSCLIQNKEADFKADNLELSDMKEQIKALCSMVNQMELRKPVLIQREQEQGGQTSVSAGSNTNMSDMDSTESRQPKGNAAVARNNSSAVCCRCSKKSLCKTMKCECRARGGGCGTSCGCAPSKCANRGIVSLVSDDSVQRKMTKNVEKDSSVDEMQTDVLASQGAMLLQDALVEKVNEINDIKGARRKPLSDVGNKMIQSHASNPKQRKIVKNVAIRLVSAESPSQAEGRGTQEGTQDSKVPAEIPLGRTRVTRSSLSNNNS